MIPASITRFRIIVNGDDRIWSFRTDQRVQGLILRCIVIGHKFNSELFAVVNIIQVNRDDCLFCPGSTGRKIKKIRIHTRLFFNIIRKKIIFCLEMMIKTSIGDTGFFADILDRQLLITLLLQDPFGCLKDLGTCSLDLSCCLRVLVFPDS